MQGTDGFLALTDEGCSVPHAPEAEFADGFDGRPTAPKAIPEEPAHPVDVTCAIEAVVATA